MKKLKVIASLAFLLNTLLFGSYYSVAKEVLGRVDPIVFTFFTMLTLVPPAICIIAFHWKHMTKEAVKSGFVLGSCLCLGLFTLAVALKYNSATGTAFFPSLNALLAVFCTWLFLRQPMARATWFAGAVSVVGAILLITNASIGGARGALIAFIGGLFCTFYVFLSDHEQKDPAIYWPLFGVELLTMALWANLIALLFGDWQMVNFTFPKDVWVVLFIGLGTIFLPTLISLLLQKYISPITVSFIYILEPILGTIVAAFYLHEILPLDGYLGGGLIVAGAVIHTWGTIERPNNTLVLRRQLFIAGERMHASLISTLLYPVLCCATGIFIVYKLGGFPPQVWSDLYLLGPQLPALMRDGQGFAVSLLLAQSASWLIAWISIVVMGGIATYRAIMRVYHFYKPIESTVDIRTLRQLGYTPFSRSAARRRVDKPLVLQRRQRRQDRLHLSTRRQQTFRVKQPQRSMPMLDEMEWVEQQSAGSLVRLPRTRLIGLADHGRSENSVYNAAIMQTDDTWGNHWVYWDELGNAEMREQ
ncbi:DMT family transporter [Tengunoibacter tsumagoiensis]|uniref:EamA domain-containing protein n=1 Tax=Tengunoibacter tsumagoiensis TaxID=2014871 RepID=A0A402A683_9CHLR|nr:DMT family transporter [Tengunoibacter tsumagoiensis]GCE14599.1 hypothetical protein KTT_44580 [Tengunoibacter tsumagoiensis]